MQCRVKVAFSQPPPSGGSFQETERDAQKERTKPRDLGCSDRWANRHKAAHSSADGSTGDFCGSMGADRRLTLRRLSAKA